MSGTGSQRNSNGRKQPRALRQSSACGSRFVTLKFFCSPARTFATSRTASALASGCRKLCRGFPEGTRGKCILLSGIPWLLAIPAMLLSSWHSDKTRERRWHAAVPILMVGVALACSQWAGTHVILAVTAFSVATMALYAFPSPFWALPTLFLTGPAAAASIAFINSVGNLGGFAGPYVIGFLTDKTGTYQAGIFYLVASGIVGGLLVLSLRSASMSERAPASGVSPNATFSAGRNKTESQT